ncbi:putative short chain dehydrogenase/reductase [Aspergillus chevalieri]|uniref:Short chain dehydrogenase/reductase n=1 Tax=Aspergillus chevalieri TaxID=182096 RepID=A0A7R7VT61_ASPCH|nr:uncharacterized protein ACHE_50891S [Aspergillus chevalieri]BCR89693.1 hypothetical protein ACHE_50891S [Aspergillus chevalieri]
MPRPKSIIITGGASGIGLGITHHFLSSPAYTNTNTHVTILDINPSAGAKARQSLRSQYPTASVSFEHCDVSSWESQAAAFERVFEQQGGVDVVFANAGVTESVDLVKSALWSASGGGLVKPGLKTVDVNLSGVLYTVHLGIHYISKNTPTIAGDGKPPSKGSIICTASNAGLYAFPMAPIYSATKHGVIGLVRSLAPALEREQIQINALAPAVIETNLAPSSDLFKAMILTPMSTATKAAEQFVDDSSLTGNVAELHGEHVTFAEPPEYVDEDTKTNIETFAKLGYA